MKNIILPSSKYYAQKGTYFAYLLDLFSKSNGFINFLAKASFIIREAID